MLYLAGNDLGGLPAELSEFPEFLERRRRLIGARLAALLGVGAPTTPDPAPAI